MLGGNPLFVSIDKLVEDGLLPNDVLDAAPAESATADFAAAQAYKWPLFERALQNLRAGQSEASMRLVPRVCRAYVEAERSWLDDYALFMAIKEEQSCGLGPIGPSRCGTVIRKRSPPQSRLSQRMDVHRFVEWQFERQWQSAPSRRHTRGIELFGDVPIFVAHDSVEVWSDRSQFLLHPMAGFRFRPACRPTTFPNRPVVGQSAVRLEAHANRRIFLFPSAHPSRAVAV